MSYLRVCRTVPLVFLLASCFSADLDPTRIGVFACADASDCPGELACSQQLCVDPTTLPQLLVGSPEDLEAFPKTADEFDALDDPHTVLFRFLGTNLDLVAVNSTDEHVDGQGHLIVVLDGEEVRTIDDGDLAGGVSMELDVRKTAGAHRISVRARRNDGLDYQNEGAVARRVFFFNDGAPHVAALKPWPGAEFSLDAQTIDVEAVAINFTLAPFGGGTQREYRTGHVHPYYDATFPDCRDDPECDRSQFAFVDLSEDRPAVAEGSGPIPASGATETQIVFTLRHINHDSYDYPFMEPGLEDVEVAPIFEEIPISRVANPNR